MEPLFYETDRVLTFNWAKPKPGDVIVFELKGKHFIKRVELVTGVKVTVSGDNKKLSSKFRPIDRQRVIGRVILKY